MGTSKGWETRRENERKRENEWADAALAAGKEEAAKVCDRLAEEADVDASRNEMTGKRGLAEFYQLEADAFRRAAAEIRKAIAVAAILLALLAAPALAEEPPAEDPATTGPFVAAAWCTFDSGATDTPGCDGGGGVSLAVWGRLRWVAVVGSQTLGTGVAWVPRQGRGGPVFAVAAGAVVRYDGTSGIDSTRIYPAIGMTVGFGRP